MSSMFAKDSPAEKVGMRTGDLILEVNHHQIVTLNDLSNILQSIKSESNIYIFAKQFGLYNSIYEIPVFGNHYGSEIHFS